MYQIMGANVLLVEKKAALVKPISKLPSQIFKIKTQMTLTKNLSYVIFAPEYLLEKDITHIT